MSGIKPLPLTHFYRRIHNRGLTADLLADKIVSGRTHVTEVLNGTKDSPRTWRRLARFLKPSELALLGRDSRGVLIPQEIPGMPVRIVPRGALSPQRHCEISTMEGALR